jgi:hypothetical protein
MAEAGDPYTGVEYEAIDEDSYRISLSGPLGEVEYVSSDSLDAFLGDSFEIIRSGG